MRIRICSVLLAAVLPVTFAWGEEPLDVTASYQRIVADYQRIVASTRNSAARAAAGRLTRDAYRSLLQQAEETEKLSADDLYALGACNEAIGETDKAKELYASSLSKSAAAKTHLALARVNLQDDLAEADKHFAGAIKVDAQYPGLSQFRLVLAAAHSRQRNWQGAAGHLEKYLSYTKTISDRVPASGQLRARHEAVIKQLDQLRRFDGMTGKPAPAIKAEQWAKGESTELAGLKGKVVLVDFCAMWAAPSRKRMERLKELQAKYGEKGLEVVGLTLAYQHKYDAEADKVTYEKELTAEEERAGLAAFAKKHEIAYRIGVIDKSTVEQYGVATLPHTVVIDKAGNVSTILLSGEKNDDEMETVVKSLLGIQ